MGYAKLHFVSPIVRLAGKPVVRFMDGAQILFARIRHYFTQTEIIACCYGARQS